MPRITAKEVKRLYGQAFPYLVSPPECKDRFYELYSVEVTKDLLLKRCQRHKQIKFENEIADCDDYVLQAYAEFKWYWSKTSKDGSIVEKDNFSRMYDYHTAVGMGFGIKFRGRMVKHSVMTVLATEGMYIYDAVSREMYVTNINQDILLHVSMQ